jgi:two-component system LytT family response regulator
MRALLIDDETGATDVLQLMIERYVPKISEIFTCNDARDAVLKIKTTQPDIVFLDIKMPHFTGFELLQQLSERTFSVIFTTAYHEYAIQAIRISAIDYLLKPIDTEELIKAVYRVMSYREKGTTSIQLIDNLYKNLLENEIQHFKLVIHTMDKTYFVQATELVRCEALNNYTKFFMHSGKKIVSSRTLKEYEDLLVKAGFIRVHKSHLLNLAFVKSASNAGLLEMTNGFQIEISRRRRMEVLTQIAEWKVRMSAKN